MKILHLGAFDCAAYSWNLTDAFNKAFAGEHEMITNFQERTRIAKWTHHERRVDHEDTLKLIDECDLVILCCAVFDYRGNSNTAFNQGPVGCDLLEVAKVADRCHPGKAIIFLPGSTSTRSSVDHYKRLFDGYRLFCSNTDLAKTYEATWIPSCIEPRWDSGEVAYSWRPRRIVSHFGTDARIKNTQELKSAAFRADWEMKHIACGHDDVPKIRDETAVCFDNMQGYSCVVSMESWALGQANIVHMRDVELEALEGIGVPVPPNYDVSTEDELAELLGHLSENMDEACALGAAGREWYTEHMTNDHKARLFAEKML